MLGEADFDIGKYANSQRAQEDKLPLRGCSEDPDAFVEIYIKAKNLKAVPPTPSVRAPVMPPIEERNSESDIRDEFENKERMYKRNIESMSTMLQTMEEESREKQDAITEATIIMDLRPEELLDQKDREVRALEEQLAKDQILNDRML